MLSSATRAIVGTAVFFVALIAAADGDPERGETLTATCVACHSDDGNSIAGSFPSIAGQHESYLTKQLREIKSGERSAPLMMGLLDAMSDQDLQDMAAFYASKTINGGAANPDLVELGEAVYRAGIKRKNVAACSACHSPSGHGNDPAIFPALAGQWAEYTEAQLKMFRSGERANDGDGKMMRLTAMDMSDEEIAAVSSYIRGMR